MKANLINALRKGTDVLLNIDSHEIVLIPHARVKKPGGVYDYEAQPARQPQTFQIEPNEAMLTGISGASGGVVNIEGARGRSWSYILRGAWDSEMAINDTWQNGETEYKIISIQPYNGYERTAVVEAIGKDPQYGS